MEALHAAAAAAGGGGGGGPAPFLLKTYEMVDDPSTNKIVSWSSSNTSFVVWNPPDFAERLLPTYFKHNNFSSFIRQLNTYGFRKIDAERWEFANEEFIKGQKHLLKNIHRRKPIHSHSHPPGGLPDAERAALEEEIDRLSREKAALLSDLRQFKQQQSGTRIQLDDLERRLADMEQRQLKMMAFLQHAIHNPRFVDNLVRMAAACSEGLIATHKKRRVPRLDYCADSSSALKSPEIGQVFNGDFSDKLKLELCPAISGSNLISPSTQSSNEDVGSPYSKQADRMECLSFVPESLDLADTGASMCPRKNVLFPRTLDKGDDLISCHLNLTLASCSMQVDRGYHSDRNTYSVDERIGEAAGLRVTKSNEEDDLCGISQDNQSIAAEPSDMKVQAPNEAIQTNNQAPAGRVNDVFWEQFLTERPGATDAEEACSSLRTDSYDAKAEEKKLSNDSTFKNRKAMEQLSL